ncbi:MAG: PLDc N-terminal domain-containing protein [Dongiaceae bacterium]
MPHAVGIVLALHALLNGRTPQGTIAWLIALVLLPYVAVPLYLVFGGRGFRGYVRARRSRNADLRRIVAALEPEEAQRRSRRQTAKARPRASAHGSTFSAMMRCLKPVSAGSYQEFV